MLLCMSRKIVVPKEMFDLQDDYKIDKPFLVSIVESISKATVSPTFKEHCMASLERDEMPPGPLDYWFIGNDHGSIRDSSFFQEVWDRMKESVFPDSSMADEDAEDDEKDDASTFIVGHPHSLKFSDLDRYNEGKDDIPSDMIKSNPSSEYINYLFDHARCSVSTHVLSFFTPFHFQSFSDADKGFKLWVHCQVDVNNRDVKQVYISAESEPGILDLLARNVLNSSGSKVGLNQDIHCAIVSAQAGPYKGKSDDAAPTSTMIKMCRGSMDTTEKNDILDEPYSLNADPKDLKHLYEVLSVCNFVLCCLATHTPSSHHPLGFCSLGYFF